MGAFVELDCKIREELGYMPNPGCCKCGETLAIIGFEGRRLQVYCRRETCGNHLQPFWIQASKQIATATVR